MRIVRFCALITVLFIAGCKPPPTDADIARDMPAPDQAFASEPLPSPETEGAVWAQSTEAGRIIYGIPGQPVLVSLQCIERAGEPDVLRITRLAPADEGAGALLALIGNGAIGRLEVDATEVGGRSVWQGEAPAYETVWEPLNGPRQITVTVPGAGMVTVNPSPVPEQLLAECREDYPPEIEPPLVVPEQPPKPVLGDIP